MNRSNRLAVVYAALLVVMNATICGRVFSAEWSGHMNAMHGPWISLARLQPLEWVRGSWWPYWGAGGPLEYTYAPLVPILTALIAKAVGISVPHAYNMLSGCVYCLGPLTLFELARRVTGKAGLSLVAGGIYSLLSLTEVVLPEGVFHFWDARRFYVAFVWDEVPHLTAITIFPVAVLLLALALKDRKPVTYAFAVFAMAFLMAASAFGCVLAAIAFLTVPLAVHGRLRLSHIVLAFSICAGGYLLVSPFVSPSLLQTIRSNSAFNGEGRWSVTDLPVAIAFVFAYFLLWRACARYVQDWGLRLFVLLAFVTTSIPAVAFFFGVHLLPQPMRYKVEMEWSMALLIPFAARAVVERSPRAVRFVLAGGLICGALFQFAAFRRYAAQHLQTADVTHTIEWKVARWAERNLSGQRLFMSGSLGQWLNVFTDMHQLTGQPYTTALNQVQQIALYTIFTGQNAGTADADTSILWLRAFGVGAIAVPGSRSPEYWKPFANPGKFEGKLPVLWKEQDTTIYGIPNVSSLAHVIGEESVVSRRPIHGLDVHELRRYVSALDYPGRPAAKLRWDSRERAVVTTVASPGDSLSVQINYHSGWHARVLGRERPIARDGLGLMVIRPDCQGPCEVELSYERDLEKTACLALSGCMLLACLAVLGWTLATYRRGPKYTIMPTSRVS